MHALSIYSSIATQYRSVPAPASKIYFNAFNVYSKKKGGGKKKKGGGGYGKELPEEEDEIEDREHYDDDDDVEHHVDESEENYSSRYREDFDHLYFEEG